MAQISQAKALTRSDREGSVDILVRVMGLDLQMVAAQQRTVESLRQQWTIATQSGGKDRAYLTTTFSYLLYSG